MQARAAIATVLAWLCAPFLIAAVIVLLPFAAIGMLIDSWRASPWLAKDWNGGAHQGRYRYRSNGHSIGCDCGECAELLSEQHDKERR